jgi:hypothetical protein
MKISKLVAAAALALSANIVLAQSCTTFIFAGECVQTTLSEREWIANLRANPMHARCAESVPSLVVSCEEMWTMMDKVNAERARDLASFDQFVRNGGGTRPTPALVIVPISGY